MMPVNIKSNLFRVIVIALLTLGVFVLAERQQRLSIEARGQLIRKSLEINIRDRYLPLPPYPGKIVESKNIYVRDSTIIRNNLPELPEGRYILLDLAAIADSAIRTGKFDYIQLSQLNQYPDSATIEWESATATLSRKLNRIVYQRWKVDKFKYRHTPTGWIGGLSSTGHYSGLRVL